MMKPLPVPSCFDFHVVVVVLSCCLGLNQVLMPFRVNSKMAGCLVIHMLVL